MSLNDPGTSTQLQAGVMMAGKYMSIVKPFSYGRYIHKQPQIWPSDLVFQKGYFIFYVFKAWFYVFKMCYTFFFFLLCSGISLLFLLVLIFQESQKVEVSQFSPDIWEGQALLFSESIHISLTLPMVHEQVIVRWRRDLVLWSDELVFWLNPNVLVTVGVEPNNSAKLGLAPMLLPPWWRFSSKLRLKRDEGNPACKSGLQL